MVEKNASLPNLRLVESSVLAATGYIKRFNEILRDKEYQEQVSVCKDRVFASELVVARKLVRSYSNERLLEIAESTYQKNEAIYVAVSEELQSRIAQVLNSSQRSMRSTKIFLFSSEQSRVLMKASQRYFLLNQDRKSDIVAKVKENILSNRPTYDINFVTELCDDIRNLLLKEHLTQDEKALFLAKFELARELQQGIEEAGK